MTTNPVDQLLLWTCTLKRLIVQCLTWLLTCYHHNLMMFIMYYAEVHCNYAVHNCNQIWPRRLCTTYFQESSDQYASISVVPEPYSWGGERSKKCLCLGSRELRMEPRSLPSLPLEILHRLLSHCSIPDVLSIAQALSRPELVEVCTIVN